MMKFVVEKNIPFIKGLLEPFGQVVYAPADTIDKTLVADADALFVRTRTRCDASLLAGSRCRFVATATIGTDHIDLPWCAANNITVANAPGCNAPAVAQYVLASVLRLAHRPLSDITIGIVGVGHVGKIVEQWARILGMKVMLNDPPRQLAEGGDRWSSLSDIAAQADIITFHTPLDTTTRHIVGEDFLKSLKQKPIIINAARGAIVDTPALVDAIDHSLVSDAVIDCWEGEPLISPILLEKASVATPHIAGYSYEGKVRATRMALDAFSRHFSLPPIDMPQQVPAGAAASVTAEAIAQSYDPFADTRALRSAPTRFEALRNGYDLRHEVGAPRAIIS